MKSNARIIAATNYNLEKLIEEGKFREDLYYRINVVKIEVPSLKNRPEDIPMLIDYFIKHFNKKIGKQIEKVSPKAMSYLVKYSYPGNVRELENIVEHSFVMCSNNEISPEHLPSNVLNENLINSQYNIEINEKDFILSVLDRNNHNKSKTANELGMHRTTLWRKLKEYNIE